MSFNQSQMDNFLQEFNIPMEESGLATDNQKRQKPSEQKGRHRLNEQINELKLLLPECRYVSTTKASILECAVNSLRKLQAAKDQLEAANQKLENENSSLRDEIQSEDMINDDTDSSNSSPGEPLPEIDFLEVTSHPPQGFESSGSELNLFSQGTAGLSPLGFSIPTSSFSSSFGISSTDNLSFLSKKDSFSAFNLASPQNSTTVQTSEGKRYKTSQEDFNTKISKRRLLLVLLLVVPMFLNFNTTPGVAGPRFRGNSRSLMSMDSEFACNSMYIIDLARVIVYTILGLMGVKWITSSFIWLTSYESTPYSYSCSSSSSCSSSVLGPV